MCRKSNLGAYLLVPRSSIAPTWPPPQQHQGTARRQISAHRQPTSTPSAEPKEQVSRSRGDKQKCIGRESNPGLADIKEDRLHMATANFTTKPPMQ
jgi:hypothetical protein